MIDDRPKKDKIVRVRFYPELVDFHKRYNTSVGLVCNDLLVDWWRMELPRIEGSINHCNIVLGSMFISRPKRSRIGIRLTNLNALYRDIQAFLKKVDQ